MGWPIQALWEVMNEVSHDFDEPPDSESIAIIERGLSEMPSDIRIALARELLAGTGRFVAKQHEQVVREFSNGGKIVQTVLIADYPETTAEPTP